MNSTTIHQIAERLLLSDISSMQIGLYDGQIGVVLFLLHYGRCCNNEWYIHYGEEMFNDICGSLHKELSVTFANGLCGIGWSVEYLKYIGNLEDETDDILEEIDQKIMERDVRRLTDLSLETGLTGIVAYVQSRLNSQRMIPRNPFPSEYLQELQRACHNNGIQWDSKEFQINNIWEKIIQYYQSSSHTQLDEWKKGIVYISQEHPTYSTVSTTSKKCFITFYRDSIGGNYGIGTYIKQLIQCFDPNEWEIHVVKLQCADIALKYKEDNGVSYHNIPYWSIWKNSSNYLYARSVFYYLQTRCISTRIYCHFNMPQFHELAQLFKERLHVPILFTLHYTEWSFDLLGDRKKLNEILSSKEDEKKQWITSRLAVEKQFMHIFCDKVIAIARHSYEMLKELYEIPEEKLVYIPNGLKDDFIKHSPEEKKVLRHKYGFNSEDKIIIFAGRLNTVKGIVELLKAYQSLKKEIPKARLIIAGDGDFKQTFDSAAPLWSNVIFTGFLPKEQLYELYSIADVGVVPSLHEEFGYVAIEMMIHQLPIVAHCTTGLKEITDNGRYGIVFHFDKDRNCIPLQESLSKALIFPQRIQNIQEVRNRALRLYSIDIFRKRIMELFKNAIY